MRRIALIAICTGAAAVAALALVVHRSRDEAQVTFMGEVLAPAQITLGQEIYAAQCASCHGVQLEGQPDWKRRLDNGRMPAPPHDASGHTWHHPDQQLFIITKHGLGAVVEDYDSDMPAFQDVLTDDQIRAVLGYIKSTWPPREREYQDQVSSQDAG